MHQPTREAPSSSPATVPLDVDLRPERALLGYYALASLVAGPFFFLVLLPLFFRFRTLRYRFDEEGVSMAWGVLFRREVYLTYARIQDIHLNSNVVERWLGLARVEVQTASGSSKAEMTIEGRHDFEALRDFLYRRMRGMEDEEPEEAREALELYGAGAVPSGAPVAGAPAAAAGDDEDLATVLLTIAAELRQVRQLLEARETGHPGGASAGAPAAPAAVDPPAGAPEPAYSPAEPHEERR